ncbi:ankyrin repeat-containing domain protein [Apiospora sp. TS-2023a]
MCGLLQLSDDLLLLIFLEHCDHLSAFSVGLTCRKLVDLIHGEFYRKAAQHDPASVVGWAVQRGTVATLDRLSYHLPPGQTLGLDARLETLMSPVCWGDWKRYPNGNMYKYFTQTDYVGGIFEEGLVDLDGVLLNRKKCSSCTSILQQHSLSGWTPLHIAALFGNPDMVEYLVTKKGMSIGDRDLMHDGQGPRGTRTVTFYAAVSEKSDAILPCMIRLGANVNQKVGNSHMTLLAYLCDVRCYRQALVLLRAGAKADFKTVHRRTLLHLCVHSHNYATTNWSKQDLVELIQALITEGAVDPNAKDRTGNTFLHLAAQNDCQVFICAFEALASLMNPNPYPPVVACGAQADHGGPLLKIAFDVDAQNARGETVLMIACDKTSLTDYLYDRALPYAGNGSLQPVLRRVPAIQVFLEALRPSTGLKDAQGRRVTDRICRVGKRGAPHKHRNSVKHHLEAYIRSYLQFPASPDTLDYRAGSTSGNNDNDSSNSSEKTKKAPISWEQLKINGV